MRQSSTTSARALIAIAPFYKHIDHPIYGRSFIENDVTYEGRFYEQLGFSQPQNAEAGHIGGVELTYQNYFTRLPAPFDGLGVNLNYTVTDSSVRIFGRDDQLPFFKQSNHIGNVAVLYEKFGVATQVSLSFNSPSLGSVGANARQRQLRRHLPHRRLQGQRSDRARPSRHVRGRESERRASSALRRHARAPRPGRGVFLEPVRRSRLAHPMILDRLRPLPAALLGAAALGLSAGIVDVAVRADIGAQTPRPASRHVILVSIDGFAAYHLADSSIDLPNIRALAAAGAAAESSETVFPSVTHPSHTTLVTGVTPRKHGVVDNTVTDRRTGKSFHITSLPRRESVRVPTIFDAVRKAGLRSSAFFWPETRDDPAIDFNIAEVFGPTGGADSEAVTPGLLDELRAARVPIDTYYAFYGNSFAQGAADVALTQAAAHVFLRNKPALTAIHLLVTDDVQHEFGPAHYLSRGALTTADYCVGLLRRAVADAGLTAETTIVIGADHGFITVKDEMNVAPIVASPELDGRVRWTADKWYLFAERTARFDAARDSAAFDRVLSRLAATKGIARVIRPEDFAGLGFPDYDDNPYARGHVIVAADADVHLVLEPKSASVERRRKASPYHGHGYLPDHPSMRPLLVLSGAGIAPGRSLGRVRNLDVAPTIAALLGLSFDGVEGRVLREALQ